MIAFWYITKLYLKYFIIILSALTFFMVGFDYLSNSDKLTHSANLTLLYLLYKLLFAIDMMLPLSLIFAMISTKIHLINSNALVAFYSLGLSKIDILRPFVVVSVSITLVYIALHATPFAKADEYSNNIRSSASILKPTSKLFFTYQEYYIYFGKLYPLQDRAEDIRIFKFKNDSLTEVLVSDEAYYRDDSWHISRASLLHKPEILALDAEGIVFTNESSLRMLDGFKPTILDQVYEGKVNYTIVDALEALRLLSRENINVDKIKSALYRIFASPFFVPSLIVIMFFMVPISSRFLNVTLFSFAAIVLTIVVWSILFVLTELSNNKTISSEIGILLPAFILVSIALYEWYKERYKQKKVKT